MAEKYAGFGAALTVGGTPVPSMGDLNLPGMEPDMIDVTTHDSPGGFEEAVAAILKSGDCTFSVEFDPANAGHQALITAAKSRAVSAIVATLATSPAATCSFDGWVGLGGVKVPVKGSQTMEVKIKASGEVTWA